jgi:uncharacterized membrane protein/mono/diheme cytochrome c family protein
MRRLGYLLVLAALAPAQEAPSAGLPERVGALFAHKCSQCHGADVVRPKGRFGYVEDLARVAETYVKPGDVEQSLLWSHLMGEQALMPPKKAKNGPLALDELALVRWWILDGAKAPQPVPRTAASDADEGSSLAARSHVLLVHFPIALIVAALLAEVLFMWRRSAGICATGRFCIVLAALSALLTAFTGWSSGEAWSPARVDTHRWLAVSALITSSLAALVSPLAARPVGWARLAYRLLLVVAAVLVSLAAHQGGILVHGEGYLGL